MNNKTDLHKLPPDALLSIGEVADYLNTSIKHVKRLRNHKLGPRQTKRGLNYLYRRADVDEWLEQQGHGQRVVRIKFPH